MRSLPRLLALLATLAACLSPAPAQRDLLAGLPWNNPAHGAAIGFKKDGPTLVFMGQGEAATWFHGYALERPAMRLPAGTEMRLSLPLPKDFKAGGHQLLLVAELRGTTGDPASTTLQLNGQAATVDLQPLEAHPMRSARVVAVPKGNGAAAIDGNPRSYWGTGYKHAKKPKAPFQLDLDLGQPRSFHGFEIHPGMPHYTEGMPLEYGFLISQDGKNWKEIAAGTFDYSAAEKRSGGPRQRKKVEFGQSHSARFVRFETRKLLAMNQVNLAEIDLLFDEDSLPKHPPAPRYAYLHLDSTALREAIKDGSLGIRLACGGKAPDLILSDLRAELFPAIPNRKNENKPNGRSGPDRIGIGMLGFDALTVRGNGGLPLMNVIEDTPADRAGLQPGDLIVAVDGHPLPPADCNPGWQWFYGDPEPVLGRACLSALSRRSNSIVRLDYFRQGERRSAGLDLDAWGLPAKPDGRFPLGGPLAEAFEQDMIKWIVENQKDNGSWGGEIQTCFAVLGLLGTRDPAHAPAITRAIDWAIAQPPVKGGLSFWGLSFNGIMQCEYYLATGDPRVLPWIERCVTWMPTTSHTSKWKMPCFGHGPGGLPYGQKALMAPLTHMLVFEALAERCGIEVENDRGEPRGIWEIALPYCVHSWSDPADGGHGAMGYNASYKDLGEFWSRSGLFALAAKLRDAKPEMQDGLATIMHQRHPWMRNSHAYGAPGNVLGLLGLASTNRESFAHVMSEWSWSFLGAWHPGQGVRWTMPHMGAPYMGEAQLIHPMYLTLLSAKRDGLHVTGASDRNWLSLPQEIRDQQVFARRLADGRVGLASSGKPDRIVFTTDGSEPAPNSVSFDGPFAYDDPLWIRFRAINQGKPGPVQEAFLKAAPPKTTVIRASGSGDAKMARRNASSAFDRDLSSAWSTDLGQLAKGYPHSALVEFAEPVIMSGLEFRKGDLKRAPAEVSVRFSQDGEEWSSGQTLKLTGEKAPDRLNFRKPLQARFLELKATQPQQEGQKSMQLVEITPLRPQVAFVRTNDGRIRLEVPKGMLAFYTLDGSHPLPDESPVYKKSILPENAEVLTVDLYTSKGTKIGRQIFSLN